VISEVQAEVAHKLDPQTIGEWVLHLRPDFAGVVAGGRFMVVYSYEEPVTGLFFWALGHSGESLEQARAQAMFEIAKARSHGETAAYLAETGV
jgi:hypothetical protein